MLHGRDLELRTLRGTPSPGPPTGVARPSSSAAVSAPAGPHCSTRWRSRRAGPV
ncbi:hypothetical protein [Pseudonocardia sp. ICBG1293]|uniref:hypothetical protein n=1 Tax=Pseudonocardia sp. ICBG1293 TaxID=2844382 RepID=UPI001CCED52B|nr:hypothetical protein [Pseudonocardia sp. ICBG1293]